MALAIQDFDTDTEPRIRIAAADRTFGLFDRDLLGGTPGAGLIRLASESEWVDWLIAYGELHGWLMFFSGNRRFPYKGHAGYVDLTALRAPRIEAIETKSEQRRRKEPKGGRPAQQRWGAGLSECASANPWVRYRYWSPRDLAEVMEALV